MDQLNDDDDDEDDSLSDSEEIKQTGLYPKLDEEPAMPKINVDREQKLKDNLKTRLEKEGIIIGNYR